MLKKRKNMDLEIECLPPMVEKSLILEEEKREKELLSKIAIKVLKIQDFQVL